jgi:hypothetical protein
MTETAESVVTRTAVSTKNGIKSNRAPVIGRSMFPLQRGMLFSKGSYMTKRLRSGL